MNASDDAASFAPVSSYSVDTLATAAVAAPPGTAVRMAGRVVLWRSFGSLVFGHLQDRSGRVQVSLRRDELGADPFRRWSRSVRLGDFVGIAGKTYTTDKGEPTVGVAELVVLNKAVRPIPDKWKGVNDPEVRYRKRYLDLLTNAESRDRMRVRSRIIARLRQILDELDFLEVETPILQEAASGAAARPFVTTHNALSEDFYLRISPETYLKRAVAGSLERVYELGRNFRNEGVDPSHLQEFTMLEWYAAYWDYRDNMRLVQRMILAVLDDVIGTRKVRHGDRQLDFDGDWPELDYRDEVLRHAGVDLTVASDLPSLRDHIRRRGLDIDVDRAPSYAALTDVLYKRTVRPSLVRPCFLLHHPAELVPLARRNDVDPTRLDMFQVIVNGWEIVKAYSELVDAREQRVRLEEQTDMRRAGDEETMMLEEDFLECMEHGMPPMSGVGLGVDRLVALLTDAPTLRDVVLFPLTHRLVRQPTGPDAHPQNSST